MSSDQSNAVALWAVASRRLLQRNELLFRQWFCNLIPLTVTDQVIRLGVPDDFFGTVVSEQYDDLILDALRGIDGADYRYEFESGHLPAAAVVPPPAPAAVPAAPAPETQPASPFTVKSRPRWQEGVLHEFTFENFVVSEANRHAFAAAGVAATEPGLYNPLFLHGSNGVGKTHLLRAIAHEMRRLHPDWVIRCTTSDELINGFYELMMQKRSLAAFRSEVCDVDALLIDDVHNLSKKKQLQDDFFHIFNTLHGRNKQIVFTSDRQPCEIPDIEARLSTRFESGMVSEVCMPEYEARLVILRKWRAEMITQTPLDDQFLEFLASNITSSVRRLKSAFLRLATHASLSGNDHLSLSEAEDLLHVQISQEAAARGISLESIQHVVASQFGLTNADLLGKKRSRRFAEPRMIAMFLARELTSHSSTEIGAAFGRNHATVLYAEKQIPELCRYNEDIRSAVSQLRRQLQRK